MASRLAVVRDRIAAAATRAGRVPDDVTLIGAIKTLPADVVAAAHAAGLLDLGENRVQEAEQHQQRVPRGAARWHMIGHLQRNKVGRALALFDLLHGVDDAALARTIDRRAAELGQRVAILLEVNVSGEASKFGVAPESLPALLDDVAALPRLDVHGLMTIGAPIERMDDARIGFARLRALRDDAERRIGRRLPELSMGMSSDFEVGIAEGATMVRVGTALFGARPQQEDGCSSSGI